MIIVDLLFYLLIVNIFIIIILTHPGNFKFIYWKNKNQIIINYVLINNKQNKFFFKNLINNNSKIKINKLKIER